MANIDFVSRLDNSQMDAAIAKSTQKVGSFVDSVTNFGNNLETQFKRAALRLTAYVGIFETINLGKQIVEVTGQFQQLSIAFETMLDSKAKADQIMSESIALAQKTPFTLMDVTTNAKQLMAMGVSFEKVMGTIKNLGDVAAGVSVPLSRIAINYGQVLTLGKLQQREIRDFAMAGVPLIAELAKNLGKTTEEITGMVSAGRIGAKEVEQAFQTMSGEGGKFFNLMDKQNKSITGQISNLVDKWQVMMNDIGTANSGFIYDTIGGISTLMANYKEVINIIQDLVVVYGSYKAAVITVNAIRTAQRTTQLIEEGKVINQILTLEQAEILSKKKLIEGTAAYTLASKAELTAELAKQKKLSASLGSEVIKREAVIATKEKDIIATNLKMTAQAEELALALKFDRQAEINIATQNLQTTGKELQTLTTEKNTLVTGLNTLQGKANTVSLRANTIETTLNTGAQAANTASLNLLTIAKARGAVIAAKYNAVIAANPYLLLVVALAAATFAVYKIITAETEAEKAEKSLHETIKKTNEERKRVVDEGNELTNVIRNQTSSVYEQVEAFNELIKKYDFFKKYSIEEIQAMTAEQWKSVMEEFNISVSKELPQANYNKQLALVVKLQKEVDGLNKIIEKGGDVSIAKSTLKTVEQQLNIAKDGLIAYSSELDKVKKNESETRLLSLPKSEQEEYHKKVLENLKVEKKALEDSLTIEKGRIKIPFLSMEKEKTVPNVVTIAFGGLTLDDLDKRIKKEENILATFRTSDIVKNKAYWTKIRDDAQAAIDVMFPGQEGWDEQIKIRDNAEKKLQAFSKTKNEDSAKKEEIALLERLDAIAVNETKLADIATNSEISLSDAILSAMDDGYAKQKEQQNIKFQEKLLSVKKQGEEMLKLQNDIAEKEFLVKNPKGVPPAASTTLSTENQAILDKLTKAAEVENAAITAKLLKDKLIEYGDYATERLEIEKKFNADIKSLQSERTKENSKQIDAAIIQAETDKAKALMAQSFNKLKESPEFAMAFEDLGNVSTETLEKLISELKKYKQEASRTMKLSDFKEYSKVIENVTDEFIKRNPFKVLKESADDLLFAQRKLQSAKEIQSMVESGLSVNKKGELIPIGSTEKAISYEQALEGVAQEQDNVTDAENKGTKALKTITDAYGKLSSELSSVGDSIGGTAGVIISSIGNIGSFVTTSISAWEAASKGATKAIQAVEKASIILGVISAVIGIATKIVNLFTSSSKKRREEAENERKAILEVKKAYLEAYAAMSNKKFDNIFGEDVWGKAKEQVKLIKEAGKNFADAYLGIVEKFGKASKFKNFLDNYLEVPGDWSKKINVLREVLGKDFFNSEKLFNMINLSSYQTSVKLTAQQIIGILDNFDVVSAKAQLARNDIDEGVKVSLQALVDAYESYQEYLENIDSYLTGIFGDIGNSLMDSLDSQYDDMTGWADDVTNYISDAFGRMIKDIVYSMYFTDMLSDAQEDIKNALTDNNTSDQSQIQNILAELNKDSTSAGTSAAATYKMFIDSWKSVGGSDWTEDASKKTGLAGQITESITEDTGRELAGLFRSFRDDARITRDTTKIGITNLILIEKNTANTVARLDSAIIELQAINKNTKEPYTGTL